MAKSEKKAQKIQDRIIDFRRVKASDLVANPKNWRKHPEKQKRAMEGILAEVGYVDALLARELPDGSLELIDGHLRQEVSPDAEVPVLVVDLDEAEAAKVLATFDPISAMAEADDKLLRSILEEVQTKDDALSEMLASLAEENGIFEGIKPAAIPELNSGDRDPYQEMSFILHDSQVEAVKKAMEKARADGEFDEELNNNRNGNSLARIAERYLNGGEETQS